MGKFFEDLKEGLEEAVAYEEGKQTLRKHVIEIPEKPAAYTAKDVIRIRNSQHCSQGVFAKILNVSVRTVQAWESGLRRPSQSALRLLEILESGVYQPKIQARAA